MEGTMGKKEAVPNRRYTEEFKAEAVRLALSTGGNAAAKRLGIPQSTMTNWVRQSREESSASGASAVVAVKRAVSEVEAENTRLRRELASAKLDLEIVKKAAAGSTDQSNVLCRIALEVDDGSNGKARSFAWPEEGVVAPLEGWSVPIGDWRCAWQACCVDTRRAAGVWWDSSTNAIPI
jgi:transposase